MDTTIDIDYAKYIDLTYHITPLLGITNGRVTVKNGKAIPIILLGERHTFKSEDIKEHINTYSILDIIEKYVLYNLRDGKHAKIVINYEASWIKDLNIDTYFKVHDFKTIPYNDIELIFSILDSYKEFKNNDQVNLWTSIRDKVTSVIALLKDYNKDLKSCEDLLNKWNKLDNIGRSINDIKLKINKYIGTYYKEVNIKLSIGCILDGITKYIKDNTEFVKHIVTNYADELYSNVYKNKNNVDMMSQLNLIYAGGWLKPLFKSNKSTYLPFTDMFKCHLKLVNTITSITDKVEVYNIDYRTHILNNIKSKLKDLPFEHTYAHYEKVYDLVMNLKQLSYKDSKGNSQFIENPIPEIYNLLCKKDKVLITEYFKKTFLDSVVSTDNSRNIENSDLDIFKYYYWVLDLYGLLKLIYMSKQDTLPTMFISILGDHHRRLQHNFLLKWYSLNVNEDKYTNYVLKYTNEEKITSSIKNTIVPGDCSTLVYTNLINDNTFTNTGGLYIKQYLNKTFSYFHWKYVHYSTYMDSLNSYDFFTKYDISFNSTQLGEQFKLDIVDNFGDTCGIESFDSYDDIQKDRLLKYLESTCVSLFPVNNVDQKTYGGKTNYRDNLLYKTRGDFLYMTQDDFLYKTRANFAKCYMDVCGYDDPVKLMTAINFHLIALDVVQRRIDESKTGVQNIDITSYEYSIPKKADKYSISYKYNIFNPKLGDTLIGDVRAVAPANVPTVLSAVLSAPAAGGHYIGRALGILLISALIIVIILLLCNIQTNDYEEYPLPIEYMLVQSYQV